MILIGQYDSSFVRRVAIALRLYDLPFEHRPWSVFSDGDKVMALNPLMRVPTLVLDDGEVLVDSASMIDFIDGLAPAGQALFPRQEPQRRRALKVAALATGIADKAVSPVLRIAPARTLAGVGGARRALPRADRRCSGCARSRSRRLAGRLLVRRRDRPCRHRRRLRAASSRRGASRSCGRKGPCRARGPLRASGGAAGLPRDQPALHRAGLSASQPARLMPSMRTRPSAPSVQARMPPSGRRLAFTRNGAPAISGATPR